MAQLDRSRQKSARAPAPCWHGGRWMGPEPGRDPTPQTRRLQKSHFYLKGYWKALKGFK